MIEIKSLVEFMDLKVGQRVFYKGDLANLEGYGKITTRHEIKNWGIFYDIQLDDKRTFYRVPLTSFLPKSHMVLLPKGVKNINRM